MLDVVTKEHFNRKLFIEEVDVCKKRVFVRADLNVPLSDCGVITDDTRILALLPTIRYLMEKNAKIILASHLGRPKGIAVSSLSLKPVAERLTELLGKPIKFLCDCIGPEVEETKKNLKPGEIVLLENLRFHDGEKKNEETFIKALSENIEVYINDAFGTSHRDQASMTGVPKHVTVAACGFLVKKEIDSFLTILAEPRRPYVAILGGAKVSDKIGVLKNLLESVDSLLIGGGMAYTFLKMMKFDVGNSLVENDYLSVAQELVNEAKDLGVNILLPVDNIVANKTMDDVKTSVVRNENIPSSWVALDIGPETVRQYVEVIKDARTIFWNGPMGVFEKELFRKGTEEVAIAVAESQGKSIVGGGDTVAAIKLVGVEDKISHISTGGGASLELIQGKLLPGIIALSDRAE